MRKYFLCLVAAFTLGVHSFAVSDPCHTIAGSAMIPAHDLKQLVELGADVSIRTNYTQMRAYDILQIAEVAKKSVSGSQVTICVDDKKFTVYDLKRFADAGVKLVILN